MSEDTQLKDSGARRPPSRRGTGAGKTLSAKALGEIRKSLLEQRVRLEEQLLTEGQAFSSSESEIASETRNDENPAEAGSATFEREKHLSIANNIQNLLEKNARALNKIEHGSYGRCESCGGPIAPERLKALPHALMCIECKKAEERR